MPRFLPDPIWHGPDKNVLEVIDKQGLRRLADMLRKQQHIILDTEYSIAAASRAEEIVSLQFGFPGAEKGMQYAYLAIGARDPVSGNLTHELAQGFKSSDEALAALKAEFSGIAGKGKSWIMHHFGADARWLHKMGIGLDPYKDNIQDTMWAMYREGRRSGALKEYAKRELGIAKAGTITDVMLKEGRSVPYLSRARLSRYAIKDILYTGEAFFNLGEEKDPKVLELQRVLSARQVRGIDDPLWDIAGTVGFSPAESRAETAERFLWAIKETEKKGGVPLERSLYKDWLGFSRFQQRILETSPEMMVTGSKLAAISAARKGPGVAGAWSRAAHRLLRLDLKGAAQELSTAASGVMGRPADDREAAARWIQMMQDIKSGVAPSADLGLSDYELRLIEKSIGGAEAPTYLGYSLQMQGDIITTGKRVTSQLEAGRKVLRGIEETGTVGFAPAVKRMLPPSELDKVTKAMDELLRAEFRDIVERGPDLRPMIKRGDLSWRDLIKHLRMRESYEPWSFAFDKDIAQSFDEAMAKIEHALSSGKIKEAEAVRRRGQAVERILEKQVYEPVGKELLAAIDKREHLLQQVTKGLISEEALAEAIQDMESMYAVKMSSRLPGSKVPPSIGTWFKKQYDPDAARALNRLLEGAPEGTPFFFDVSDLQPLLEGQATGVVRGYAPTASGELEHMINWFVPRSLYEELAAEKEIGTHISFLTRGKPGQAAIGKEQTSVLGAIRGMIGSIRGAGAEVQTKTLWRPQRSPMVGGTIPIAAVPGSGVEKAARGINDLIGEFFDHYKIKGWSEATQGQIDEFFRPIGASSAGRLETASRFAGRAALPLAAAGLILGAGLVHMLRARRSSEAWATPSRVWGDYTQPGQAMQEEDLTPAGYDMGPPPKQGLRLEREQPWDTRDLVFTMNYNRVRHWNMDQSKHSALYGGMAGRL